MSLTWKYIVSVITDVMITAAYSKESRCNENSIDITVSGPTNSWESLRTETLPTQWGEANNLNIYKMEGVEAYKRLFTILL